MRKIVVAALALSVIAGSAAAQPSPVSARIAQAQGTSIVAAEQPAGVYQLDGLHSSVIWRLRHAGLALFTARLDKISGTLTFDPANPAGSSITVTIAANSVSTGILDAQGQRKFDTEIANGVLGAEAHPSITFVSKSIQLTGATTGLIRGDLTVRGVTKPVVLEASFDGGRFSAFRQKHGLAFSARAVIRRSEFGAVFANSMMNGVTGDEVEILIQTEFLKD